MVISFFSPALRLTECLAAKKPLSATLRGLQRHLLRSEMAVRPGKTFLHEDVARTNVDRALDSILAELSEEVRMWPGPQARATEGLLAVIEVERELVNLRLPANRLVVEEDALKLGVGRPQLERILKSLHSGAGLSSDDAKRREELLASYCRVRNVGTWTVVRSSAD